MRCSGLRTIQDYESQAELRWMGTMTYKSAHFADHESRKHSYGRLAVENTLRGQLPSHTTVSFFDLRM